MLQLVTAVGAFSGTLVSLFADSYGKIITFINLQYKIHQC